MTPETAAFSLTIQLGRRIAVAVEEAARLRALAKEAKSAGKGVLARRLVTAAQHLDAARRDIEIGRTYES